MASPYTKDADTAALVAMPVAGSEAQAPSARIDADPDRFCRAVGVWGSTWAIVRTRSLSSIEAAAALEASLSASAISPTVIGAEKAAHAVRVHARYGKGSGHPACLDMGDCFAYACAATNGATLLYKGDDFSHTDSA